MLITDPEGFADQARRWSVRYADAPENTSSKTSAVDSIRRQEERRKKQEEADRLAQYVGLYPGHRARANKLADTVAIAAR